ncbi:MAG: hypothetical protein U0441_16565 [Polyangiaceae bacterium]
MKRAILTFSCAIAVAACGGTVTGSGGDAGTTSTGGTTASGGNGTGGNTAGSSTGGTVSSGGTTASGGTTTGTDCGPCDWSCCGTACINTNNDILNCGACGTKCGGAHPYCDNGKCADQVPCNGVPCAVELFCCGSSCCQQGDLCCDVPGPVEAGPKCTPPTENGTCPAGCAKCVCASPDSPIATPTGERAIRDLAVGDLVYSVHQGQIAIVPILEAVHVPAPNHVVVEVTLANGRTIEMSPKHPTADGRTFGSLRAGDSLEGAAIATVRTKAFEHDATYDILPDSDSGTYFAAGALVGSTLAPTSSQHCGQVSLDDVLR